MIIDQLCLLCNVNMWIFDILFISIFYFLFFKIKLYIHHYISVLVIIALGISLDIYLHNYIFTDKDYVLQMIFKLISEIILSLGFVIDKYIMEKKFCSPYEIFFFHGIINFALSLLFLSFSKEIGLDDYKKFFLNPSLEKFYAFVIFMLIQFIFNIFILIINKNTTPYHILIMLIIGQFCPYIDKLINNKNIKSSIILIIGLFIILFFSLIFNEIIEINCLGLSKNTKKNIALRAKKDRETIRIEDNDSEEIDSEENEETLIERINDSNQNESKVSIY